MRAAAALLAAAAGAEAFDVAAANATLQLAYAASCGESTLSAWDCSNAALPWCRTTPGVVLQEFLENTAAGTQGYVAVDAAGKRVIVSYRGTSNWQNDLQDAYFLKNRKFGPDGVKLDAGFFLAYKSLRNATLTAVSAALRRCSGCSVLVTGHSLGAAMATIAAADIASQEGSAPVDLFCFASPRAGNADFAAWFPTLPRVRSSLRMRREKDIVPAVPPRLIGYHHVGTEIYNTHAKGDGDDAYVTCDGSGEDKACGDREEKPVFPLDLIGMSGDEHCRYMGYQGCRC